MQNQRSIQPADDFTKWANCTRRFAWLHKELALLIEEWATQKVCMSAADIIEDGGGFGIQMTDDKEFTSRRWAEQLCTWGRRDVVTFSNHCDSAAIECSFVILCWLYFQMTRISIRLAKCSPEFHICTSYSLLLDNLYPSDFSFF